MEDLKKNELKLQDGEKNICDRIANKMKVLVEDKQLVLPHNYVPENALKSAWLTITQNGLENTDKTALANALLNMCVQGLNPAKNQCYFINYGGKVSMSRSYFGDVTVCKHTGLISDVFANCIYKDDVFEIDFDNNGRKVVKKHETKLENLDKEIIGAYAVATYYDGRKFYEIMTRKEIDNSWKMSKSRGKLHNDYTQEACKRTVIRRLVKMIFNTSVDNNQLIDSYSQSTKDEYIDGEVNEVNADYEAKNVETVKEKIVEKAAQAEFSAEDVDNELESASSSSLFD